MSERSYTVKEIDDLRNVISDRWLFGTSNPDLHHSSRCYKEEERVHCVEDILRTHMIAGHVAQDLREADKNES